MAAPQSSQTKRVVVTGGAGFIGSHVVDAFLSRDYDVLVIDDLSTGKASNVTKPARLEQLDITDGEALRRLITSFGPQAICHLAAQSSVTVSVRVPAHDLDVNVRGTFHVCESGSAVAATVVFASTGGALYGDAADVPTPEEAQTEPLAPYGASKLAGEAYVGTWGRLHNQANATLRLGNVFGPRQSSHGEAGVVAIFSDRLGRGVAPTVYGDGRQTRDYVHVSDVARAFVLAAEAGVPGTFNVGWGNEVSVLDLLETLQRAAGTQLEPAFEPLRRGELHRSALHPGKIRARLGWRPEVPLEEGLAETYRWYAETASAASGSADG